MIFILLSRKRKNCWEENEHANQMLKNTIKKKKSHLELGQCIVKPKRRSTIPNIGAQPLICK